MKRIFALILAGLGIIAGFCLAFTILVVLIARDGHGYHDLSSGWMPFITLILVVAFPAIFIWGGFRLLRNFFFRNLRRRDFEVHPESEDKMS
jgi:cytochrome c biogenesis protein CcdA